jgi:hypothetical protein
VHLSRASALSTFRALASETGSRIDIVRSLGGSSTKGQAYLCTCRRHQHHRLISSLAGERLVSVNNDAGLAAGKGRRVCAQLS